MALNMMRARFTVQRKPYVQGPADDYNESSDTWGPAEDVKIFGIGYPRSDEVGGVNRLEVDKVLLTPPNFTTHYKDRFILPDEPDEEYEVVGVDGDAKFNPFSWNPGGRVAVKRTNG